MRFTVFATVLSMAAFAIAAPIASEDVVVRQNHGMCVKGTAGTIEEIEGC
ncbi:predicted protein [Plenodomus lingam JN3]|uniref:Predicted protein n=1 Tax=Leptosphaeria maculans (strain JN3 / isolate v23.1.3 / race Av1-4-5-6-7-8) TaxID=985895 RepID=E5A362_LEPMJ|nr:predicted protein [Plenodomus lingam JN3]CBX98075.1 predicted protein [Plenodomus lingam JN3]